MKLTEHKRYYVNGILSNLYYIDENGKFQGQSVVWWPNGNFSSRYMYLDDKVHGESITYDEGGNIVVHKVRIGYELIFHYSELSEIDRFELSLKYGIEWFDI